MAHWAKEAVFYHIYPLGMCGAPPHNDFSSPAVNRLARVAEWIPHLRDLGVNALYLGPVFESSRHGYDTRDYYHVDRRLGGDGDLRRLVDQLHGAGIRVILDAVFNHTGRDFWAFQDVLARGQDSPYCGWYSGMNFGARSPYGDPFNYDTWAGHASLVKLNLQHPDVRGHLFGAVEAWARDFDIDGLRLDAADTLDFGFLDDLSALTRRLKPDFWLMGEVVHGDYTKWAHPGRLDAVTNYECYKGLYSSLNDTNYFEIAYALQRQFGQGGLYRDLPLYNFADNHDVDRVASSLKNPAHLYPLYVLLFTMPGVPSLYYGSEFGAHGRRTPASDVELRPEMPIPGGSMPELCDAIRRLAWLRRQIPALMHGDYRQLKVEPRQLAFERSIPEQSVVVMLNADSQPVEMKLSLSAGTWRDALNPGWQVQANGAEVQIEIPATWGRVLVGD